MKNNIKENKMKDNDDEEEIDEDEEEVVYEEEDDEDDEDEDDDDGEEIDEEEENEEEEEEEDNDEDDDEESKENEKNNKTTNRGKSNKENKMTDDEEMKTKQKDDQSNSKSEPKDEDRENDENEEEQNSYIIEQKRFWICQAVDPKYVNKEKSAYRVDLLSKKTNNLDNGGLSGINTKNKNKDKGTKKGNDKGINEGTFVKLSNFPETLDSLKEYKLDFFLYINASTSTHKLQSKMYITVKLFDEKEARELTHFYYPPVNELHSQLINSKNALLQKELGLVENNSVGENYNTDIKYNSVFQSKEEEMLYYLVQKAKKNSMDYMTVLVDLQSPAYQNKMKKLREREQAKREYKEHKAYYVSSKKHKRKNEYYNIPYHKLEDLSPLPTSLTNSHHIKLLFDARIDKRRTILLGEPNSHCMKVTKILGRRNNEPVYKNKNPTTFILPDVSDMDKSYENRKCYLQVEFSFKVNSVPIVILQSPGFTIKGSPNKQLIRKRKRMNDNNEDLLRTQAHKKLRPNPVPQQPDTFPKIYQEMHRSRYLQLHTNDNDKNPEAHDILSHLFNHFNTLESNYPPKVSQYLLQKLLQNIEPEYINKVAKEFNFPNTSYVPSYYPNSNYVMSQYYQYYNMPHPQHHPHLTDSNMEQEKAADPSKTNGAVIQHIKLTPNSFLQQFPQVQHYNMLVSQYNRNDNNANSNLNMTVYKSPNQSVTTKAFTTGSGIVTHTKSRH